MISAERFTVAAKRMCALAMSDAARLKHPLVGTEHLLGAIIGDPLANVGKNILLSLGVTPAQVLHQLLILEIPLSRNQPPLNLAPIAEKVFVKAVSIADELREPLVGTEHFLAAMAVEDCAAIKMLEAIGVPRARLLTYVRKPKT